MKGDRVILLLVVAALLAGAWLLWQQQDQLVSLELEFDRLRHGGVADSAPVPPATAADALDGKSFEESLRP